MAVVLMEEETMNVLSLFDGISCGQQALKESNFKIDNYFSSEVNSNAIKVTMDNFPETKQIGDITKLIVLNDDGEVLGVSDTLKNLPKIDLLIGGSPCQGISRSKPIRENLKDERSKLFYHYVKIKEWLIYNNNKELMFLLENVKPNDETKEIISDEIDVNPLNINSNCFVAQDRERLYWTNINVKVDNLKECDLTINDIIENEQNSEKIKNLRDKPEYLKTIKFGKKYMSWDTSGKGYYSQQNRARFKESKMNTLTKSNGGDKTRIYLGDCKYRNATVTELERFQGLDDGYTDILTAKTIRKGLIGDAWTVDVIVNIFNGLTN